MNENQMIMVTLEQLVREDHAYRIMKELIDYDRVLCAMDLPQQTTGAIGYTKRRLVLCLMLQFMEDLSDRELEMFLQENNSAKWFCEFGLMEKTPDFTVFTKVRALLGLERIELLFNCVKNQLKEQGYASEQFTFVDSTALISKVTIWAERDKLIKDGIDELNNVTLPKVAHDKEAKMGCKGKNKYWYGYKSHTAVDMESGMITAVNITPANICDTEGLKAICPETGYVYADKGYVGGIENIILRGGTPRVILKNNMKEKDLARDAEISKKRSPYERVFSKRSKRVRYVGTFKNNIAELLHAIGFNLKRLVVLAS